VAHHHRERKALNSSELPDAAENPSIHIYYANGGDKLNVDLYLKLNGNLAAIFALQGYSIDGGWR
jgi:hypothetical protein